MAGYKLVEAVKNKGIYKTDNQVAKALGLGRQNVSNWKNSERKPDGDTALLLADLAGITPREAYNLMQSGFAQTSLLILMSVSMLLILKPELMAILMEYTLCEVKRKIKAILSFNIFRNYAK